MVPDRVVAAFDGVVEILAHEVRVLAGDLLGLIVSKAVPALAGLEVVLDPDRGAFLVHPLEGVGAEAVLVAGGLRGAAVAHEVRHLVRGLRGAGPEVPLHVRVTQTVFAQALLGMDEVRELHCVAHEKHRGVVAHDVVVAVLGVKAQGETVHVAQVIRVALLTRHGGETGRHRRHGALLEELRLGVLGHVLGNVQLAEGAVALGVRDALRDRLAVEVRELFHQVHVTHDGWPLQALLHGVVFRGNRVAGLAADRALALGALALLQYLVRGGLVCLCFIKFIVSHMGSNLLKLME